MLKDFRAKLAHIIYPEITQPTLIAPKLLSDEYHCVFHGYTREAYPEDGLTNDDFTQFKVWCYTAREQKWLNKLTKWIMDTQGNYVLRYADNPRQADFGRATINATELINKEVERLASLFDKDLAGQRGETFDPHLLGIADDL